MNRHTKMTDIRDYLINTTIYRMKNRFLWITKSKNERKIENKKPILNDYNKNKKKLTNSRGYPRIRISWGYPRIRITPNNSESPTIKVVWVWVTLNHSKIIKIIGGIMGWALNTFLIKGGFEYYPQIGLVQHHHHQILNL